MKDELENQVQENIDKLSETERYMIMEIAPQVRFAGTWGFLVDDEENFELKEELIKEETENVEVQRVANGYIFTAKPTFLVDTLNTLVPDALSFEFSEKANERKQTEKDMFAKFMISIINGKESKFVKTDKKGQKYINVGLYCTNNVNLIRLNGREYKAFKLTLLEAMLSLKEKDSSILDNLKVIVQDTDGLYIRKLKYTLSTKEDRDKVFNAMHIAETKTGAFITFYI